ncbi:hypothetical protein EJ994_06605 [Maribacter sp. MJ134]|uniref:N,N-dimethylformamidase beta subunit family domain-containing protein n=1 Tax=Maribacter sp. MJ134 TaxID=2496865 RepID=UPI000F825DB1|nr:N,N-dimethylformamidase beta subunit family domain-containing protein [Maribacter sp. MJ134]AZQ58493.1 hypothetical protein EJ994_06605 [Maribacter sp. MJ134]
MVIETNNNWELNAPATQREIEGYASMSSINKGETIALYINTKAASLSLSVFRTGWYNGSGALQVVSPIIIAGQVQAVPLPDKDGMVSCDWKNPYILQTSEDWQSGVYLVKLEESLYKKQSYIIFVLRDDEANADILFQLPVTTYQAYNYWGGKCLYPFGSGSLENWGAISGERAKKVSFDRPYAASNNPKAAYGTGAGDFLTNTRPVTTHDYPISSAGWDYNMVRWLEKHNYKVKYCTNIDIHINPKIYENIKIFLSNGHDEYWTYEMRQNLTKARNTGTNLAFFSSNTMYWQIRLEDNPLTSRLCGTIVCFKERDLDPVNSKKVSINFENIPEIGSQAKLIGVQYLADPVLGDIRISNPKHWVFKGTGLKKGSRLKGLLGYEIDGVVKESPEEIAVLAATKCRKVKSKTHHVLLHMTNKLTKPVIKIIPNSWIKEKRNSLASKLALLALIAILMASLLYSISILLFFISFFMVLLFITLWFLKIKLSTTYESHMTIYTKDSGGTVYATGSMQWCWGLDNYNSPSLRKDLTSKSAQIITKNVLAKLGANQR